VYTPALLAGFLGRLIEQALRRSIPPATRRPAGDSSSPVASS